MLPATNRRADPAVPFAPGAIAHVLLQTSPVFRVLAVSNDRNRLLGEMAIRYDIDKDEGLNRQFRMVVKDAHVLS